MAPSSVPDSWDSDMDLDPNETQQSKRKQPSSPTPELSKKKKGPKTSKETIPSSVPDDWDMENNPDKTPQHKRKQTSSPITEATSNGKIPKKTTAPVTRKPLKIPNTADTDSALKAATTATEYACELVQSLADEYYSEEHIGQCLSKVVWSSVFYI